MITKIRIKNFKVFGDEVEVELGNPVVFIGPNNSGKTSALQALSLWKMGVDRWLEKRSKTPKDKSGVSINRLELFSLPTTATKLLWHKLRLHDITRKEGKQQTKKIYITITVEGENEGDNWKCALEFYYANDQMFWCRPVGEEEKRALPDAVKDIKIALLPPMSGLATQETRIDKGAINVKIGEGRTAEVLRNLCYLIINPEGNTLTDNEAKWDSLVKNIYELFGVTIQKPVLNVARGEIEMSYLDKDEIQLDLSSAGRGMQQTLLLLAFMYSNPNAVILIDEPDAHLEIIRQQQTYRLISDIAVQNGNQIIIATHSEKILNEAAERDKVVAFVGKPHVINAGKRIEILKSLTEFGWEQYFQAEEKGWVLYTEGSTDLLILQEFAKKLEHKVVDYLKLPFVYYIANQPNKARSHFFALKEAVPKLRAIALLDNIGNVPMDCPEIKWLMWEKNEIENYFCLPDVLRRYARSLEKGDLFESGFEDIMTQIFTDEIPPAALIDLNHKWWFSTKATDGFLNIVFEGFYAKIKRQPDISKGSYYKLINYMEIDEISKEVNDKLDAILEVASNSN